MLPVIGSGPEIIMAEPSYKKLRYLMPEQQPGDYYSPVNFAFLHLKYFGDKLDPVFIIFNYTRPGFVLYVKFDDSGRTGVFQELGKQPVGALQGIILIDRQGILIPVGIILEDIENVLFPKSFAELLFLQFYVRIINVSVINLFFSLTKKPRHLKRQHGLITPPCGGMGEGLPEQAECIKHLARFRIPYGLCRGAGVFPASFLRSVF